MQHIVIKWPGWSVSYWHNIKWTVCTGQHCVRITLRRHSKHRSIFFNVSKRGQSLCPRMRFSCNIIEENCHRGCSIKYGLGTNMEVTWMQCERATLVLRVGMYGVHELILYVTKAGAPGEFRSWNVSHCIKWKEKPKQWPSPYTCSFKSGNKPLVITFRIQTLYLKVRHDYNL